MKRSVRHLSGLSLAAFVAATGCASAAADVDDSAASAAAATAVAFRGADVAVNRSMPDVDAIGYEVDLAVTDASPGRETFAATTRGTFATTRALDEVTLDLEGNTVDAVLVDGAPVRFERRGASLAVALARRAADGARLVVEVRYHGAFRQVDGADPEDFAAFGGLMVRQRNAEGARIFGSLSWPSKARRWLPLRDHPRDGARIAFRLTFPKELTVVANGRLTATRDAGASSRTWEYESSAAMPPYDFHVAAYDRWTVETPAGASRVPIATYVYSRDEAAARATFRDAPRAFAALEQTFGPYAWEGLTYIEEPIFGGGMEHASVVSMDETLFSDRAEARETAIHELGHHWSGNLVRIASWNDFWLSEGFTDYLTGRAIGVIDGEAAAADYFRRELVQARAADLEPKHALRPGGRTTPRPGEDVGVLTIFDAVSYQKGARVLRALEGVVGREPLTAFLRSWFAKHASQAVTTPDFERELSAATGVSLAAFFDRLVYGQGYPTLGVRVTPSGGGYDVVAAESIAFPLDLELQAGDRHARVRVAAAGHVEAPFVAEAIVVDPDDHQYGAVPCGGLLRCKAGFHCSANACVP